MGKLREAGHYAELDVDGILVNKMAAWTEVAQDRDRWRAVVAQKKAVVCTELGFESAIQLFERS